MTQNSSDVEIANQGFAAFRQDLNDVLEDIATLHSGNTAPTTTYANQWWYELDTNKLYIRNEDNDAWIELFTLDQVNDKIDSLTANSATLSGALSAGSATVTGGLTVDTDTLYVDSTNNRVGMGTSSPTQKLTVTNGYGIFEGVKVGQNGTDIDSTFLGANSLLALKLNGSEKMRINSNGNVGIGTSPGAPETKLHVEESGAADLFATFENSNSGGYGAFVDIKSTGNFSFSRFTGGTKSWIVGQRGLAGGNFSIYDQDNSAHRLVIDSSGNVLIGKPASSFGSNGLELSESLDSNGWGSWFTATPSSNGGVMAVNRLSSDGELIGFYKDSSVKGKITVSGSLVSYLGGHLARWSRLLDNTQDETILKGTVMTNLDEMVVWSHDAVEAVEAQDAVYDDDGNVVTEAIEAVEAKDAFTEDNEQLNHMSVSSVEGDPNVAGVFVDWDIDEDGYNDMIIAMTGDLVIRIAQGTTVARGDLLMSAGDGTAKPQGDDIVRSKTIAKVTSTNVSHTYDDGSYCVPCVLMAC